MPHGEHDVVLDNKQSASVSNSHLSCWCSAQHGLTNSDQCTTSQNRQDGEITSQDNTEHNTWEEITTRRDIIHTPPDTETRPQLSLTHFPAPDKLQQTPCCIATFLTWTHTPGGMTGYSLILKKARSSFRTHSVLGAARRVLCPPPITDQVTNQDINPLEESHPPL